VIFVIGIEAEHLREIFHVDGFALRTAVEALYGERLAFHGAGMGGQAANIMDVDQLCVRHLNAHSTGERNAAAAALDRIRAAPNAAEKIELCFNCYRVERTSSRAGLSPAVDQRLFTAH
jgi:hypothetical protein